MSSHVREPKPTPGFIDRIKRPVAIGLFGTVAMAAAGCGTQEQEQQTPSAGTAIESSPFPTDTKEPGQESDAEEVAQSSELSPELETKIRDLLEQHQSMPQLTEEEALETLYRDFEVGGNWDIDNPDSPLLSTWALINAARTGETDELTQMGISIQDIAANYDFNMRLARLYQDYKSGIEAELQSIGSSTIEFEDAINLAKAHNLFYSVILESQLESPTLPIITDVSEFKDSPLNIETDFGTTEIYPNPQNLPLGLGFINGFMAKPKALSEDDIYRLRYILGVNTSLLPAFTANASELRSGQACDNPNTQNFAAEWGQTYLDTIEDHYGIGPEPVQAGLGLAPDEMFDPKTC